jgi:phosphoribulokinase
VDRSALLVTGTVGAGKTTVAIAVAKLLAERGAATGFIDVDAFSRLWPPPPNDRFRAALAMANVRSTAPNFWEAGAEHLVLAWAVENQHQSVPQNAFWLATLRSARGRLTGTRG